MERTRTARARELFLALAGAGLTGAILGLPDGVPAMLTRGVTLAVIILGLLLVMVPPLYIAATTLDLAPPARAFASSLGEALAAFGVTLLALAAPLAFLVATSRAPETVHALRQRMSGTVWTLGNATLGFAALLAVRALYQSLFERNARPGARRPMVLYLLWLAIGFSIGANLFQTALAG